MTDMKDSLAAEKKTLTIMIGIYCRGHHQAVNKTLCDDCQQLLEYALKRLGGCKFGSEKPVCSNCSVHCYKPEMREKIRNAMKYAGPRMAVRHPLRGLGHLLHKLRSSGK
jgi:hypothetical protein